jgi:hypothetical protein
MGDRSNISIRASESGDGHFYSQFEFTSSTEHKSSISSIQAVLRLVDRFYRLQKRWTTNFTFRGLWRQHLPFCCVKIRVQVDYLRAVMVWRMSQEETPRQVPVVFTFFPVLLELMYMVYGTSNVP